MAYVSNMPDEEEKNPSQGTVPPVGGGTVQLAPSGGVGSTSGTSSTPSQNPSGGSFATLDKYLAANQGTANPLVDKITSSANKQYGDIDAQTNATIAGLNKQVTSAPGYTANNPDVIAQAAANPVSFASDQGNVKQFQSLLNNSYGGPLTAEGTNEYATQQGAINNAIAQGKNLTGTAAGRSQLISQNEAAPSASVTGLNSAILSSSPQALARVQGAYDPFSNLLTNLQTGGQQVNQTIGKEQADVAASTKAANAAINNQVAALNTGVQQNLDTTAVQNAKTVGIYNSLIDTLGSGMNSLSPDQAAALGLTPDQAAALQAQGKLANTMQYMTGHNFGAPSATQDINNTAYLQQLDAPTAETAAQAATPEQFKTLMALLTLNNGRTPDGALIDPSQATQAGTYVAPTLKGAFDYDTALANATALQQQERSDAQAQADALTSAADAAHNASKSHTFGGNLLKVLESGGKYLANPLITAPQQISGTKKFASKI